MKERSRATAERFNIVGRIEKIETDLMQIKFASRVDFDLDGFYDDTNEVIILVGYDIPLQSETYFKDLRDFAMNVVAKAKEHGLARTLDKIEDYGRDLYFVFEIRDKEKFYNDLPDFNSPEAFFCEPD